MAAAATAAKSLQSCPTLCDPIDSSPPGSSVPGILQARILEWVAISFSMASGPITLWPIDGETMENSGKLYFGGPKSLQMVSSAMTLKDACSLEEKL